MITILAAVMIALFAAWEGMERLVLRDGPGADLTAFYLVRGVSTAVAMTFLAAWLMARYRRRFEQLLRRQSEEADRTRRFFENIVQDAGEGILSLDAEGRVRSWNRAAEEIFGYRAEEMIGGTLERLLPPDRRQARDLEDLARATLRDRRVRNEETRALRRDGTVICVRISASTLHDEQRAVNGASAIVADVTAEKELERRLAQTRKLAAVGEAAAGIAHEVRNALAGISGAIHVLRRNPAWKQLPEGFGEEMDRQVRRIAHIVEDLITYTRPGALHPQPADIHGILEEALAESAGLPEAAGKEVIRRYTRGELLSDVDPAWLQQAVHNVVANAYQAMGPGGVLEIVTNRRDGDVEIEFTDDGPGLSAEIAERAFEPFYTTKLGGTGLGLPIVRTIIEAHRGTVHLRGAPGRGTSVVLTLPASRASLAAMESRPAGTPPAPGTDGRRRQAPSTQAVEQGQRSRQLGGRAR
jgi:PAS domain S-box-containing protein